MVASTQQTMATPTSPPTETPLPAPTSTATPVPTSNAYALEMAARFYAYQDAFGAVNEEQQTLISDFNLMFDDQWRTKMGLKLGMLDIAATGLEELSDPPVEYQHRDEILKAIASETHQLVYNYATGLDNVDSSAIERATVNMQNLSNYFKQGLDELEKIKSE